jgi:hypothetical protein
MALGGLKWRTIGVMAMPEEDRPPPRRRRFQFTLASMFLAMTLLSILAAALGGMMREAEGRPWIMRGFFIVMAAALPVAMLIAISAMRAFERWRRRR